MTDSSFSREMWGTYRDVCADAWTRGPHVFLRTALAELFDVCVARVRARFGWPRIPAGRDPRPQRGAYAMSVFDDLRHAWRRLSSNPAASLGAVAMLALGIALTASMFTMVDSLLVRPVPFPEADRLLNAWMRSRNGGSTTVPVDVLKAWRGSPVFDAVEATNTATWTIGEGDAVASRPGAFVSAGLLPLLGARPIEGRLFTEDEGRAGTDDRVILSESVWRALFGGDRAIVGRGITIANRTLIVVGVLPDSFRFPDWDTALWRPIDFHAPPPALARVRPQAVVRLAEGVPVTDAMKTATDAAFAASTYQPGMWADPRSLASPYGGQYAKRAVPVLAGSAIIVFLILCTNVSGLLLARLEHRRREIGVAVALGASRVRILREAFLETAMLAAGAFALGLAAAKGFVTAAHAYLPDSMLENTLNAIDLDWRAVACASLAAALAAMVAGMLPAVLATRVQPVAVVRLSARGTEGTGTRSVRRVLLVAEVAMACILLGGTMLLVRSFVELSTADRGLDTENVIVASIDEIGGVKATREQNLAGARAVEEALRSLPGVTRVSFSFGTPPDGGAISFGDWFPDSQTTPVRTLVETYEVAPDYFEMYGVPLLRGRMFEPGDPATTVIVGERLASMFWPGADPVGRTYRRGKNTYQVIGVARETHIPTTDANEDNPEVYIPFTPGRAMVMVNIKCDPSCPGTAQIRQQVRRAQPAANLWQISVLQDEYKVHLEKPRAAAVLVFTFAAIAAIAVAGGLFAVLSYLAGRRRREFGVRLALGARPSELRALVLREGAVVVATGAAIGLAGGWWLSSVLQSLMYGITPGDPVAWIAVALTLGLIAIVASWMPAARAARTDPSALLREE